MKDIPQQITKLDAARRQLDTAIELWFLEKDEVSIHALAFAAYEVIHVVSNSRNRSRDLLFDSLLIKDEYRSEYNQMLKKAANFFKHAKKEKDVNASIEFYPRLSEIFILNAILGLDLSNEKQTDVEAAFMWWFYLTKPHLLTKTERNSLKSMFPLIIGKCLGSFIRASF